MASNVSDIEESESGTQLFNVREKPDSDLIEIIEEDGGGESSLSRRARFSDQPVDRSGWIEVCQSEPQVVTLTGVVTRGQTPGQQVKVQLEMTENELTLLNQKEDDSRNKDCILGARRGPHILIMTFLFMPFAFISSFCLSFYLGTLAWYNAIIYFSEERQLWHKLLICPVLILTFPFTIGGSAFVLALYACIIQLSWFWRHWYREIHDMEKGFYGWVCSLTGIPQCSPYNIVVLNECGEIHSAH